MFVSMWMTKAVLSVTPDTPVVQLANLMTQHRIRRLPVLESTAPDSPLLGLVSSQDVLHAFPSDINPFAFIGSDQPVVSQFENPHA